MPARLLARTQFFFLCRFAGCSQTNLKYRDPAKAIVELVDTRPTPNVMLDPF
jgi:hypothetical protein